MPPFTVQISDVPDARLGPLLSSLHAEGLNARVLAASTADQAPSEPAGTARAVLFETLPTEWRLVRELKGQSYAWPKERESYHRYCVYAADVDGTTVHIALGEAGRVATWGRDRKYLIAFLTSGAPQVPLVEFLEVDDYEETGELLAIIRGSDGGKKMYGPGDALPDVYNEHFHTQLYSERVIYSRSWSKLAVVAHEDDTTTILNHALLQARRRGDV